MVALADVAILIVADILQTCNMLPLDLTRMENAPLACSPGDRDPETVRVKVMVDAADTPCCAKPKAVNVAMVLVTLASVGKIMATRAMKFPTVIVPDIVEN